MSNCIRGCEAPRYRTRLVCLACINEENKAAKRSTEYYRRHAEELRAKRRVQHQKKMGRTLKVSYEMAIDAFGRIKDGEKQIDLAKELNITPYTLRKAFVRIGLVEARA